MSRDPEKAKEERGNALVLSVPQLVQEFKHELAPRARLPSKEVLGYELFGHE
jgi:hypothetical protein